MSLEVSILNSSENVDAIGQSQVAVFKCTISGK